jgi:hypothetical protein
VKGLFRHGALVVVLSVLSACGSISRLGSSTSTGTDGVACVGLVEQLPVGLVESSNEVLLDEARGATGKGGVCIGKVLVVEQSIRMYRVYDSSKGSSTYGKWWALTRPAGPRDAYRESYAICKTWSALDHLVSCNVKPGAQVVIGTTQSVDCDEGTYPKSSSLQVYVANDKGSAKLFVENCSDEGEWP